MSSHHLLLLLHLSLSSFIFAAVSVAAVTGQLPTLPSDISALQSFKSSINPSTIPSFSCLASWDFTFDPCSATTHFTCGVTCTVASRRHSRVTGITLDPAGYYGSLSHFVSRLTQLIILDLSNNNFSGEIPPSLSSLVNLQSLDLRSNSFYGEIPPSISALKSLETLDFSRNRFSGFLPENLNLLTGLRNLDLSYNHFAGKIPKLPPNLLELAIKANSLSGYLMKSSFDGLTRLAVIELSENKLSGTIPSWLFLLPSLQQVDLANNSFTRIDIWKPTNPRSGLVAVDLSFNRIGGEVPINFADYPVLSSLSMSYNRLRGPIPEDLGKKESLKRLFLDGNYLTGTPPAGFFSGEVSGSLGDNCLKSCPASSPLCSKSQKPMSICRRAYKGKPGF
ncbi:hypothetical protein NMG60_11019740 [Bertholletia excelsa]